MLPPGSRNSPLNGHEFLCANLSSPTGILPKVISLQIQVVGDLALMRTLHWPRFILSM